jgi:hypothetical protein
VWDAQTGHALSEPLQHQAELWSAQFSPDGRWVVTASADGTARIWELSLAPAPASGWLAELAEAVAGQRLNERRLSEPVAAGQLLRLQQELERRDASDPYVRWAHWFLRDPQVRTISPSASVTVPDYAKRRMEENTLESLREARRLLPTNSMVLARLALQTAALAPTNDLRSFGHADWLSRLALELGPQQPEAWSARAEMLRRGGNPVEALTALDHALALLTNAPNPTRVGSAASDGPSPPAQGSALTDRLEADNAPSPESMDLCRAVRLTRASLLQQVHRLAEAATENLLARNIPPRDARAGTDQLDLSLHYNGALTETWQLDQTENDLTALPRGLVSLGGVILDVRGIVQLSGERMLEHGRNALPARVCGIRVGRSFHRLQALQATVGSEEAGNRVGAYVLHFADGTQREFPLHYGEDTADWRRTMDGPGPLKCVTFSWTSTNVVHPRISLCLRTWDNPRPDAIVESLDLVSAKSQCAPFVVALTIEP